MQKFKKSKCRKEQGMELQFYFKQHCDMKILFLPMTVLGYRYIGSMSFRIEKLIPTVYTMIGNKINLLYPVSNTMQATDFIFRCGNLPTSYKTFDSHFIWLIAISGITWKCINLFFILNFFSQNVQHYLCLNWHITVNRVHLSRKRPISKCWNLTSNTFD